MHSLPNQKQQRGFSLVELLLVLGVLAILLVAAFVVFPQVRDRNQANAEVTNLTTIKAGITNLYASKGGNYTGLATGVVNQARIFPSSMNGGVYTSSAVIRASWGGAVTVDAVGTAPNQRQFSITMNEVPAGVCLGLVSGAASNFDQITVGGTGVITDSATIPAASPASAGGTFNPAVAAGRCSAAATSTIVLTSN